MKKFFLITLFVLLWGAAQAQTFVCTDVSYRGATLTTKEVQKEKAKLLGSKATLTFFDRSVKVTLTDNNEKSESFVLDELKNNEYFYLESKGFLKSISMKIKLQKILAYIKSFSLEVRKDSQLEGILTYKRD